MDGCLVDFSGWFNGSWHLAQADKALNNDGDLGVPYWDWTRLELNGQILCHGCCWESALRNPRDTNNGEKNISENIS